MMRKDKLEIGLKEYVPFRKDNLPESQVSPTTQAEADADAEEAEAAATTEGMPPAPVEENDALAG
jgi:hypothetical protein